MSTPVQTELIARLNELLTRSVYSPVSYFFDADPYVVEADRSLIQRLDAMRGQDDRHALMLAGVVEALGEVPEVGAFPLWYRDLNYLSVPWLAQVVLDQLTEDIERIDGCLALLPPALPAARAALESLRADRVEQVRDLTGPVAEARAREAAAYREEAARAKTARDAILAAAKAKADAERQAARKPAPSKPASATAPATGPAAAPAPQAEATLSPKERAKQAILAKRAAAAKGAAPTTPSAPPDPNEEGISAKEKARRQILAMRAAKGGAPPAGAPAPAATPAPPDPNEEGISAKEKARRQILKMRAEKQAAAGAPAPAAAAPTPDPDEEGISAKEKARRQVLKMRAEKQAAAADAPPASKEAADATPSASAPATPETELPDPDEPGIGPKEKARRQVLRLRAKRNP